jgi:hypothetical protein
MCKVLLYDRTSVKKSVNNSERADPNAPKSPIWNAGAEGKQRSLYVDALLRLS